jgi:hypothetical protein
MNRREWLQLFAVIPVSATIPPEFGLPPGPPKFERTYTSRGHAHLTISNLNGTIAVSSWSKQAILVKATGAGAKTIEDQVGPGERIAVRIKPSLRAGRCDFEVFVPSDTSLELKNVIGGIEISSISGHVNVSSIDSDVKLIGSTSSSVDVRVTSGDIFFEGDLQQTGSYNLQTTRGNIDVNIPSGNSFTLNARALSENINLGAFVSNLTGVNRASKGISGTHLKGGARLTLTTYSGQVLLHRK